MSDALENKAVEILDKSQAAIGAFADKLTEMAKQYGPDVADAALQMARIDAGAAFMWAIPGVALGAYAVYRSINLIREGMKLKVAYDADGSYRKPDGFPQFMCGVVGTIASGMFTFAMLAPVLDIWRWVGVFEPKLWLAKRILGL